MPLEHPEDAKLVTKALEGDPHAFDALMDQHYPSVYRLALHHTGGSDDAEDIAQETFFQAYVHLDTLNDGMRFSTWVLSIASNLSKNWIQRYRNRRTRWEEGWDESWNVPGSLLDRRTPESEYIRREERWLVFNAWAGLPPQDRDLLMRFYFRGMSYREIAEAVGVSEQVVQGRLQAARDRLKGKIAGTVEEVLDEALSGRSFPTRIRVERHSKNVRKVDVHTDAEDVFFSGIPRRIIKVGSVYKAWAVIGPARSEHYNGQVEQVKWAGHLHRHSCGGGRHSPRTGELECGISGQGVGRRNKLGGIRSGRLCISLRGEDISHLGCYRSLLSCESGILRDQDWCGGHTCVRLVCVFRGLLGRRLAYP